jgi:lipopolysaccharide biosynthesis glycosyltransferase
LIPLKEIVESKGSEAVVKCASNAYFENIKINLHFSVATYFRLLAADLIDEEKLLYLDSDILVLGDISLLWDLDMDRYPLAAVMDLIVRDFHRLDLVESEGYFNSGVMMMNLKVWRELDLGEKVLSYIFSNPKNIIYADQCGLNGFLKGNWLRLELKWNLQSPFFDKQYKNLFSIWSKEFDLPISTQNPTIVHFSGNQKPWNFRSQHPYKGLYWKYLNTTPFARRFSEDLKTSNLLKMLIPIGLKKYYWRYLNSKI